MQKIKTEPYLNLIPVFGVLLFLILYLIAAFLYPGGSQIDRHAKGFSWVNNYWCNLLNKTAIDGKQNPGRPVALVAMFFLCVALAVFWYRFPKQMNQGRKAGLTVRCSGIFSMVSAMLLFTDWHDAVIDVSGAFGAIALTGTLIGLYREKWLMLFWFGVFNAVLVLVNNYVYYSRDLIVYLPVIQKISFLSFLLWICMINLNWYRRPRMQI